VILEKIQGLLVEACQSREKELGVFATTYRRHERSRKINHIEIFKAIDMAYPDRAAICSAKLACAGFQEHQRLGSAVAKLLSDFEEKLSEQLWYDFGLRKLLAVVRMSAAYLKSGDSEEDSVVQAMLLMNGPGLRNDEHKDIDTFKLCMAESGFQIKDFLERSSDKVPKFARKAYEIEQTLRFRHGMMVIGAGHEVLKMTAEANGWHITSVDYSSVDELLGTEEKQSGKLVDHLKDSISGELSKKEGLKLLVIPSISKTFSNDVDGRLYTLLDDNKALTTAWGERIQLPSDVRVVI